MLQTPGFESARRTLLVVDDDPTVLSFVSGFLKGEYNVIVANNGPEAVQRAHDFKEEIHLLLSDFSMAGMTGIEVATKITLERPKIKVLLMSGFTGGMLVLNEGWHFLAKPFIPSQLRTLISGLVSPDSKTRF
jgi:two-component system cell cycle response regulator CpdR